MKLLRRTFLGLTCLLLFDQVPYFAQETWIGQVTLDDSVRKEGSLITSVVPWGDGWLVSLANPYSDIDPLSAIARLDEHGNLQWSMANRSWPSDHFFVPLASGNALVFEDGAPSAGCSPMVSTAIHEITQDGTIIRSTVNCSFWHMHFGDAPFQRRRGALYAGDIVLHGLGSLWDLWHDYWAFRWAVEIRKEGYTGILGSGYEGIIDNDDDTLTVAGKYGATAPDGSDYYRYFLAKLGQNGALCAYKTFDVDHASYSVEFTSIAPAPGGGYWITGGVAEQPPYPDWVSKPFFAKADEDLNILWQKVLCVEGKCLGGGFNRALPTADGGFVTEGAVDGGPEWPHGLVIRIGPDGEPVWLNLLKDGVMPEPYYTVCFEDLFQAEDGYLLPSYQLGSPGQTPPWLLRTDASGRLDGACAGYFDQPQAATETVHYLTPCDDTLVSRNLPDIRVEECAPALVKSDHVITSTVCGDVYPGVTAVVKQSNPLRLKVTGWNFRDGSSVRINGAQAPKTKFKGSDASGRTTLVAGGNGLKAMLPKGQQVLITVRNPDGHESVSFPFTR